jgi:carbon-monoxide dehydrogenase medium subunit
MPLRIGTSPAIHPRETCVKAPSFAYAKPASTGEALDLLERNGGEAKVLAGGQSLVAALNMRLSAPRLLVDITGLAPLKGIRVADDKITIGALTTHAEIESSAEIARHLPLLAQAAPHIAHVAIRNAGTLGGSLALADPAAEWPSCVLALDAEIVLLGRAGERRVKAHEFFKGLYETALREGELLVRVEFPIPAPTQRTAFVEFARRHGDYAIVGLAATAKLSSGAFSGVRLAFLGAGPTPVLATKTMAALEGKTFSSDMVAMAQAVLSGELQAGADLYNSAATKLHLARVLLDRALDRLAAD